MFKPNKKLILAFITYAVIIKTLPFGLSHLGMDLTNFSVYPWSFTPIFAIGLFGVAMFKNYKLGFAVPLVSFLVAEVIIGTLMVYKFGWDDGMKFAIYPGQPLNYLALAAMCACGFLIRKHRNWATIIGGGFAGTCLFFAVSNFGAWYFDIGEHYPRTLSGLGTCYVAGLPFFKQHLISTFLYSGILFSPLGIGYLRSQSEPVKVGQTSEVPALS